MLYLYDQGFDVYISNSRGSIYSRKHDTYEPTSEEFWDFSWLELGTGDTKAQVDYIYNRTGQKTSYLGYSMGTTQMFGAMIVDYEHFSQRVNKVAQLAPCTITAQYMYTGVNFATVSALNLANIFELGGPTWYLTEPKLERILGRKGLLSVLAGGWGTRLINVSLKSILHYA